jgi:hypothetical protein
MKRAIIAVVVALAACRQPMVVDTSGAELIPAEVAVAKLRELLPAVDVVGCTVPRAIYTGAEIAAWKVDEKGVEFQPAGKEALRFAFADVTSARLDRLGGSDYQVRIFTPAQENRKKDHFHFNWKDEAKARRVYELVESLRRKR